MRKNEIKNFVKDYGILFVIIGGPIIIVVLMAIFSGPNTKQQVHWHMPISYNLCGDTTQLSDNGKRGSLHGHNDKKIHVEGIVDMELRKETLGAFFDAANINFSSTQIGTYSEGDKCSGSDIEGKVTLLVNGEENTEYRDYILNNNDDIKVVFK